MFPPPDQPAVRRCRPLVGLELWCYERRPYGLYDKGSSRTSA
jgi:hypothetical protein